MTWQRWSVRLKQHMKAAGISQEAAAERLAQKKSQGAVAHWLSGRRSINLDDFFELCAVTSADPVYILFGESEELAMLSTLAVQLAANPVLQKMIAQPATPPLIAAAALPPAPKSRPRKKKRKEPR